ncbi:MAG: FecR domain-containing protein [Bacteroidota bacterium]
MEKDNYIKLIYKSLKGDLSLEEQQVLDRFSMENEANALLREEIELTWQVSKAPTALPDIDVEADLQQLKKRMSEETPSAVQPSTQVRPLGRWLSVAASLALLCVAAYFAFQWGQSSRVEMVATEAVKHLLMEDGSEVWLNKGSRLEFPKTFSETERTVVLRGEAYFEVEHKPSAPFTVKTSNGEVRVLGTSFSVAEQKQARSLTVNVQSGKVRLSGQEAAIELEKNERGVLDIVQGTIQKETINTQNAIAWKTGRFVFRAQSLESVIAQVEQRFQVSVRVEDKDLYPCKISAIINNTNAKEVLNKLAEAVQMQLQTTDEKTYILLGGECQ